jgi:hypothetical protein
MLIIRGCLSSYEGASVNLFSTALTVEVNVGLQQVTLSETMSLW